MKALSFILIILAVALLALAVVQTYSFLQYRQRMRRRGRKDPKMSGLTWILYALGATLLVTGLLVNANADKPENPAGETTTAPSETTQATQSSFGWRDYNGTRFYLNEDGSIATGWLEVDSKKYYLNESGEPLTGWQELDGVKYYFKADGSMARGQVEIDGENYFFTSTGANILVVNPWNEVPEGYEPDLVDLSIQYSVEGSRVDRSCYDALIEMLDACNAAAPRAAVASSYRTHEYQTSAYNRKVQSLIADGYSEADAKKEAATVIAVPGTSEHQLGLAVDIIDTRLWALEQEQENLPAQQWLMENSWRYGFILRYPKDKIDSTGIIYEPWHYRYVGKELAKEIYDSGLTLEEYMQSLTEE